MGLSVWVWDETTQAGTQLEPHGGLSVAENGQAWYASRNNGPAWGFSGLLE